MKAKKGISLITLVVTVIILLILAGITINFVIGPKSIVNKSVDGKVDTKYSMVLDRVKIRESDLLMQEEKGELAETAEEFVEGLIDEGILDLQEDAYDKDKRKIYIGLDSEGLYEFETNNYKYEVSVVEAKNAE